jgi:hypothetical protein
MRSSRALVALLLAACSGASGTPGGPGGAPDAPAGDDTTVVLVPKGDFPVNPPAPACAVGQLTSFESGAAGWHPSSWASVTLGGTVGVAALGATDGSRALSVPLVFTGDGYEQGYVGVEGLSLSLAGCASLAVDVTLPAGAPGGLRGSLILLLGPDAAWNGQNDPVDLVPGQTVTVRLQLAGGIEPVPARALLAQLTGVGFKMDGAGVHWTGALALDNVRAEGVAAPTAEDVSASSVGTFGGFQDSTGGHFEKPTRNGFLTFTADATVQGHALLWPKLGADGGDLTIGSAWFGGLAKPPRAADLVFHDWVSLEARQDLAGGGSASARLSRAFPAVRYTSSATSFGWDSPATQLAVVLDGQITTLALGDSNDLGRMSEPWALVWADGGPPTLLTFQHRPTRVAGGRFDFGRALGSVQVMPLYGVRRAAWSFDDAVVQARALVPILAAFPTSLTETYRVDETAQTVAVTDRVEVEALADDWGTAPTAVTPLPPAVYLAGTHGFPAHWPSDVVESRVATWFGPFAYERGSSVTYTLPMAAALTREPIALRVDGAPATAPIRTEMERVLTDDAPSEPGTYWLGNDESDADFMCDAWATLTPGSAARAKAETAGPRLAENTFLSRSVAMFTEPVSGQRYLAPTSYPEENLPFDKEWNSGRLLASVARCSEAIDLDLARGLWPKLLAAYRYHRIFFDWVTGSVLSSTLGLTELADGMHFAWDGMLGVGRLAKKLGDQATFEDVAYRTARQELALYDAWFQAAWTQDIDYGVGHISDVKLAAADVETRGAIDGWVEDFGCSTLEFKSFWQTTNYLYFDVPAQLSMYRDLGLEGRVRTLEYDIMPALHPSWADGNVMDPVDMRYYGSNYTTAHLVARALLFHDDPASLFATWQAARDSKASQEWYTMFFHGLAGPTLLALERARAPLVEAPLGAVQVVAASYDAQSGKVKVDFQALASGKIAFRTRAVGGAFALHPLTVETGKRYTASFAP